MRQRIGLCAAAVVLAVAVPRTLHAGSVSPYTEIAFQALTTDMLAATFNATLGTDPNSVFTYGGTFDQTGWSGTFGGTYEGGPVTGTMTGTVVGDPSYTVSGETTWQTGKKPPETGPSIMMTFDQVKGQNQYNLKNATIGTEAWSTDKGRPLKQRTDGDLIVMSGTVYRAYGSGTIKGRQPYRATIYLDTATNQVVSIFESIGGPLTQLITDSGTYNEARAGGGFNGAMGEVSTFSVPEPSGILTLSTGVLALAGLLAHQRLRSGRSNADPAIGLASRRLADGRA